MRLIDADAIPYRDYLGDDEPRVYKSQVDNLPTIDPVKHGRWEKDKETRIPYCDWCNENAVFTSGHYYACGDYCSYCGAKMAKMDGEV